MGRPGPAATGRVGAMTGVIRPGVADGLWYWETGALPPEAPAV